MFHIFKFYLILVFFIVTQPVLASLTMTRKYILQNEVKTSGTVIVSKEGIGNLSKINDAVAIAPNNSNGADGYFHIKILKGIYEEYVVIPKNKKYLKISGAGINKTIITGNHSNVTGWSTMDSATFSAFAPNFICMDITIRNTAGPRMGQAVALLTSGELLVFYKCSIEGYQDTLYAYKGKQYYRQCDVYGTIDFIFGGATVVFQKCNLYGRQPRKGQANAITAQSRKMVMETSGFIIQNCRIKPTQDLVRSNYTVKTYLGRPWKPYSRTIIMQSFIDSFVEPAGWDKFSGDAGLKTLYYAEFNNTGPGSNTTNRVTWPGYHIIDAIVASNFTVSRFIHGDSWIPQTKVPYDAALIP